MISNGVYLERGKKLFKSKAYLSLTGKSAQVYCILLCKRLMVQVPLGKRKVWIVNNNGQIQFTYKEAKQLSISNRQFRKAIDQLVDKGFIDITPGYPQLFELIDNWENYGTDKFEKIERQKTPVLFDRPKTEKDKLKFYSRFNGNGKTIFPIDKNVNRQLTINQH